MTHGPLPPFDPEILEPTRRRAEANAALMPSRTQTFGEAMIASRPRLRLGPERVDPERRFAIEERGGPPGVPLAIYRPRAGSARGALIFLHGGGMVSGSILGDEVVHVLELAHRLQLIVVEVDYALAPDRPYPAGLDDALSAVACVADNVGSLGYPEGRLVLAGLSGGGGIAAGAALALRDRGGPVLAGLLLEEPQLDDRCDSISMRQSPQGAAGIAECWDAVLGVGRHGAADIEPYAVPARADNLAGLPPTYLDVGACDFFRDEVVEFASRIWAAGGVAELHVWPGAAHATEVSAPGTRIADDMLAARERWLGRVLGL